MCFFEEFKFNFIATDFSGRIFTIRFFYKTKENKTLMTEISFANENINISNFSHLPKIMNDKITE